MSYVVKFIADDLGIAPVVVSAGNSELQRPEQTVIDLQRHAYIITAIPVLIKTTLISTDYSHFQSEVCS